LFFSFPSLRYNTAFHQTFSLLGFKARAPKFHLWLQDLPIRFRCCVIFGQISALWVHFGVWRLRALRFRLSRIANKRARRFPFSHMEIARAQVPVFPHSDHAVQLRKPNARAQVLIFLQETPGEPRTAQESPDTPGEPRRAQESPGEPRRAQDSPGEPRRARGAQEARGVQESPGEPRRAQESPRKPRRAQESPREP
jgi:hypothetical protein